LENEFIILLHRLTWIIPLVAIAGGMTLYGMFIDHEFLWMAGIQNAILPAVLSIILVKKICTVTKSKKLLVWFLIFAVTSFVAETYSFLDDMFWKTEQFPSIADGFWIAGYVVLSIFLWKNFRQFKKLVSKNVVALALGIAATSIIPTILVAHEVGTEDIFGLGVILSYPVSDTISTIPLVLGSMVFLKMKNKSWMFLLIANSAFLIGDIVFPYLELNNMYTTGDPIDLTWIAGYFLFIIAAATFDEKKINWLTTIKENKKFVKFENIYKITIPLMVGAIFLVTITTVYQIHTFDEDRFFGDELAIYWIIGMMAAFGGVILTINHNLTKLVKSRTELLTRQTEKLEEEIREKTNLINLQKQLEIEIEDRNKELIKKSVLLEEQNKKLVEIDKKKAEFASMVTHELKTPLTPILSWCDILLHYDSLGPLNDEQKNAITKVRHNARKLLRLISDILDAEKLGLNQMTFSYKKIDVQEFVRDLSETYAPILAEKRICYFVSCPKGLILYLDELRLAQVLKNFINNSIDFVPGRNGRIQLKIEQNPDAVMFSVIDNGVGMPKEKQQNLFQKFYQIDTSSTRKHGGSGLGLAICKGIIESFGGTVGVQSEPGMGSRFYFTIPKSAGSALVQ